MRNIFTLILCFFLAQFCFAQNQVLTWKDHFSYRKIISVTSTSDAIYAATELGAFEVLIEDNSITRLNKTNKLSDAGISCVQGVPELDMVIFGYSNGNLDIKIGERVINLSDIKTSSILANKQINEIVIEEDFAFICTGFGVVKLDLVRLEIRDTYLIGNNGDFVNVTDIAFINGRIVAASEAGLYKADASNLFLSNFESWSIVDDLPILDGLYKQLTIFNDKLFVSAENMEIEYIYSVDFGIGNVWELFWSDESEIVRALTSSAEKLVITTKGKTIELNNALEETRVISSLGIGFTDNYESAISPDGNGIWIANNRDGLFHVSNDSGIDKKVPNGPENSESRRIRSYFENVWSATGGVSLGYVNNFTQNGINYYTNNSWKSLTRNNSPQLLGENEFGGVVFDIMDVAIDPEDNEHVFVSSWEEGLLEIKNGQIVEIYNTENSNLVGARPEFDNKLVFIDGIAYDGDNNLWVTNSLTSSCLHVKDSENNWYTFDFAPDINDITILGDIIIDEGNDDRGDYIWVVLPDDRGILVFDYNDTLGDTSDDRWKILTSEEGNGGLPTDDVYSIAKDVNGEIWVGTLQGVEVFYNTDCLFSDEECDAQQILIEQDGNFQLLLETETITAIEIDGGNRKWIGTQTSGVYLLSDDGIDQIYRFTEDNSPLISNTIQDISFNFSTGEVFFATDKGIVSFIGSATGFDGEISETSIYPNPVREDYTGTITIDGLTFKTDVKVTDINGNIVHSTTSEGGRALWNGKNENGERVSTGIYLVFATNKDGSETAVGKIAVVN